MNRFVCLSISPACFTVAFHWPHSPFLFSSALATKSKNEPLKRYSLVLVNWPLWHNQFLMWSPCSELCLESTLASWAIIKVHLTEGQIIDFLRRTVCIRWPLWAWIALFNWEWTFYSKGAKGQTSANWALKKSLDFLLHAAMGTLFAIMADSVAAKDPIRCHRFENVWPFRYFSSHCHVKMSKLKMIIFS